MNLSIIDIGTQSMKHYIFALENGYKKLVHYKRHSEANLGEAETLSANTIARNISILQRCLDLNKEHGVTKLHLVGTEILRKASNASEFTNKVKQISGEDIEIISHDKEAQYLYEGFIPIVPAQTRFAAVNIGGGTTELVVGTEERLEAAVKIPFGAKFIRKTFGEHNELDWSKLDEYLNDTITITVTAPELFITGVLDISTTLRPAFPFTSENCPYPDHPILLTLSDYWDYIQKLRATPVEQLKEHFTKDPNFCNGYTIGLSVYYACAKKLGVERIIPSNNDLTDGIICEMSNRNK